MKRFKALGVCVFAGGFTLGVRKHFECLAHFEEGPYGVETALKNKVVPVVFTDPAAWPIKEFAGKVDFIYANPACAPWSVASHGREIHWTEDPRVNSVRRAYQLLDKLKPDVWAWESVRPAFIKGRALVNTIAKDAMAQGYDATVLMVTGTYHGVPQPRRRFFLVLHRVALPWEPTGIKKTPTVREAWKGGFKTQTISTTWQHTTIAKWLSLKACKPGERPAKLFTKKNAAAAAARLPGDKLIGRPSHQWQRLDWDKPSAVMTGGCLRIHPDEARPITVEEQAALCGYPRSFRFYGSLSQQYAQTAQAVMPPVGEYLARIVRMGLEQRARVRKPAYRRVDIFPDRVGVEPLDSTVVMLNGLEMTPQPPPKPVRIPKEPTAPGVRRTGVGSYIRQLLQEGKDTQQVLEQIRIKFPQSKATGADVSWNRRKLAGKE